MEVEGDGVTGGLTEERPTTPSMPISISDKMTKIEDEWWRPQHPPETYKWEEVRRQRKKGGYPWTLLDNENEDELDASEYLDDNLYEPVNPPPVHESGSAVIRSKDKVETGSLDGCRIDIPPEIEIVNSEGLDGLDLPDPHDFGMDGDREWVHSDDEQTVPSKILFTAGIRGHETSKDFEGHGSNLRPLINKTLTFDPTTKDGIEDDLLDIHPHEGSRASRSQSRSRSRSRSPNPRDGPPKKTTTAFEILKSKAVGAAGQVKQRFTKIALPVRPKLNQWEGVKLARKKPKKKAAVAVGGTATDQEVPQDEDPELGATTEQGEMGRFGEEPMEITVTQPEDEGQEGQPTTEMEDQLPTSSKDAQAQQAKKEKDALAEEKKKKQKEQDELKKQKAEEKKREAEEKKREAEELKKVKAEEKLRAKEEADRKKAEEKAAKAKIQEEAKKVKLEEQLAKAREVEEQERQKNEELLRLREQESAAAAAAAMGSSPMTSLQGGDTSSMLEDQQEQEAQALMAEQGGEEVQIVTPTGTGSRRKKIKKTFVQLPKLPDLPSLPQMPKIDLEFKRKVIKRSKTPPARPTPPKLKQRRGVEETENQLGSQYAAEIEARKIDLEEDAGASSQQLSPVGRSVQFPETPIFVTQPSTENSEETESAERGWKSFPSNSSRFDEEEELIEPEIRGGGQQDKSQQQQQVGAKERMGNFGQQLKGFGMKSKEMASKKSKAMGATMKVIGKDLQKFGVKTSEKFQATIDEIKLKQEAAKARSKEKAKEAEDIDQEGQQDMDVTPYPQESATEPRRKFRFRRRDDSQEEHEDQQRQGQAAASTSKGMEQGYEGHHEDDQGQRSTEGYQDGGSGGDKITRSQLLGRAERDWESPLELARSREASEEPFSGNASSRDSPPGSSLASSTFAHVRKQGVLEEIDSDEFFLREKGISEGEDEEEINRFLVEELRQAFRHQENSLAGFDLPEPPARPGRQVRKPARKQKDPESQQAPQHQPYQTFPPERPRRKAPGYISDYIKEHGEEMEETEDQGSNREERGSYLEDLDEFGEGMEGLKEDMKNIERQVEGGSGAQGFVDDGRYEPVVTEEPVKPQRRGKKVNKPGPISSSPSGAPLYYNTMGGENDWMREIDDQVLHHDDNSLSAPRRETTERSKSRSLPPETDENEVTFVDQGSRGDESNLSLPQPSHTRQGKTDSNQKGEDGGDVDLEDDMEYVDEAGYAVVIKDRDPPSTAPRRKKRGGGGGGGSKGNSLKRQTDPPTGEAAAFFSLPRFTPRSLHIVPPSRPQRTYSTVRPRRPPRHRSNQNLQSRSKVDKNDPGRPSTAIGIMQGRPLPAIPSPRSTPGNPLNNLDQSSIERAVGARHYTNFVPGDGGSGPRGVVEELCMATNISLLGSSGGGAGGDINIAIQTDPVQEFESEPRVVTSGPDANRSGQRQSDTQNTTGLRQDGRAPSTGRGGDRDFQYPGSGSGGGGSGSEFMFPRRLHLDELEVDVLRVHDLSAHSINVEHLRSSQMEVNSLTSIGPLTVSSIHTQTLNSDQINCNRLASDTVDLPTIVPPAFYNLAPGPPSDTSKKEHCDEKPEQLRHERDKEEAENDIICPYSPFEDSEAQYENLDSLKTDLSFEERPSAGSPSDDFFLCGKSVEFCLTPEQSMDNDDSWGQDKVVVVEKEGDKITPTDQTDDIGQCSDLTLDSLNAEQSPTFSSLTTDQEEPSSEGLTSAQTAANPPRPNTFRIAVLEHDEGSEEEPSEEDLPIQFGTPQNEAPVLSGSLRLEYRRSPEVPSDFQVLHDIVVERDEAGKGQGQSITSTSQRSPTPPPLTTAVPARSKFLERKSESGERKSTSTERSIATTSGFARSSSSVSREPSEYQGNDEGTCDTSLVPRGQGDEQSIQEQQNLIQLGIRFGRAVSRIVMRGLQGIIDYVDIATSDDPAKAEEQKAHMQVLLCLLLILIAGIILSSSNTVVSWTPPKWEFLMPPPHL